MKETTPLDELMNYVAHYHKDQLGIIEKIAELMIMEQTMIDAYKRKIKQADKSGAEMLSFIDGCTENAFKKNEHESWAVLKMMRNEFLKCFDQVLNYNHIN